MDDLREIIIGNTQDVHVPLDSGLRATLRETVSLLSLYKIIRPYLNFLNLSSSSSQGTAPISSSPVSSDEEQMAAMNEYEGERDNLVRGR